MSSQTKSSKNPIYHTNGISNFIFSRENIQKLVTMFPLHRENKSKPQKVEEKSQIKVENIDNYILPKYSDKLFWCYMIFLYGLSDYEIVQNSNWERECTEKIKMVTILRKHKDILKKLKYRRSELEAELTNQGTISIKVIIALCVIYDINLVYIFKSKYFTHRCESTKTLLIEDRDNQAYLYIGDEYIKEIFNKTNGLWEIDDVAKPLKSIANYKVRELQKICSSLNISLTNERGKRRIKKELYKLISEKL